MNANMKTTSSNVIGAGPSPFIVRLTPTVPCGALISNDLRVGGVRMGKGERYKKMRKKYSLCSEKSRKFHS